MKSTELKKRKRDVRKRVLALRDAIAPEERERLSRLVAERFLRLVEVTEAQTVLAFWSFGSEVSTMPLMDALHERGIRITLPRIVGADIELRVWVPGDEMTATAFGALEPANGEAVLPSEIDVVATPGVAFDRTGRRVGYGGGFYDRLIPRLRPEASTVGFAFGVQLLDEDLPGGSFDLRVDTVVTESETVWCRALR
ncbi:MAG: 5-formyltetrahydrofolate cyclo-ligase [Actinomycetota bacterium]|nr:5-formyltetrahydrofolate cyclo-ligase [Actinomycetota bacterium]